MKFSTKLVLAAQLLLVPSLLPIPAVLAQEAPEAVISPEEKEKILKAAKARLDATIWDIDVTPMWGKKADRKSTRDKLTLVGGTLHSEAMAKDGYADSNFTLTVGDDRVAVFETMQRNDKDAMVFWRVELTEDDIRGVMSVQKPEEAALSYSFRGAQTGVVEKEVPPPPAPVVEAPAVEAAGDAAQAAVTEAGAAAVEASETAAPEVPEAPVQETAAAEKPAKKGFLNF